ncbi:MAG: TetR/AcrR family transcriptional regulator [Anaerolineales bacterium]|nr:TetR/AcrR family transcriptional regulator [Anaerolineales bacterium]
MAAQIRAEETRDRLLQAAAGCFAERGYEATGTAEICRRAGVSKGAFYHHFASKQALFLELLNRWLAALDEQLAAARSPAQSVPESLRAMAAAAAPVFGAADGQLPIFLEFWSQAARDPAVREQSRAPYQRYQDFFAGLLRAGVAEGSLPAVDPELTAHVLVAFAAGLLLQSRADPQGADWAAVARAGLDLLLAGARRSV